MLIKSSEVGLDTSLTPNPSPIGKKKHQIDRVTMQATVATVNDGKRNVRPGGMFAPERSPRSVRPGGMFAPGMFAPECSPRDVSFASDKKNS